MVISAWSNFTKRINSTRQPAAADSRRINCYLKEDTSIRNPSFILNDPMPSITYVQAFGNYYFVSDVINLDANRAEVSCTLDVLATYRASILGYTAFVERSASNYDQYISDPLLSGRQLTIDESITYSNLGSLFNVAGCFIAQVFTKNHGVVLYATNTLEIFRVFLNPDCYSTTDIQQWIDKKIAQEFDLDVYIGTIKWVPFNLNSIGASTNVIEFGPIGVSNSSSLWPAGASVRIATQTTIKVPDPITLEVATPYFDDFRDCSAKYTLYSIMLPGVGLVELNTETIGSALHLNRSIQVQIMVDLVSGGITYDLYTLSSNQERYYFAQFNGNIAVEVPIGKAHSDFNQSIAMTIGTVQNMTNSLMQGPSGVPNAGMEAMKGFMNIFDTVATTQTNILGGSGNKANIYRHSDAIYLNRKTYGTKVFPTTVAGRPLMQFVQLGTLSGFCQCGNASVPVNARDAERAEINSYLNSGFYIE